MYRILLIALLLFSFYSGFGQENVAHDHESHNHSHSHNHEISIGAGVVFLSPEYNVAPGFHLHYIKGIAFQNRLGIGLGLETILEEHKHYSISVVFQYRIYKGLTAVYAPGILILKEESEKELQFAQHLEAAYEFELGAVHLGPMAGIGTAKEGIHYIIGVHFGIDF